MNENDLCGDVGYCVGKTYWGQGFATEVLNNEEELTYVYGKIV